MRGARILNSVSRSLSDVGRRPSQVGALSRRPLSVPAITRMERTEMTEETGTKDTEKTGSHRGAEQQRRAELSGEWFVRPAQTWAALTSETAATQTIPSRR